MKDYSINTSKCTLIFLKKMKFLIFIICIVSAHQRMIYMIQTSNDDDCVNTITNLSTSNIHILVGYYGLRPDIDLAYMSNIFLISIQNTTWASGRNRLLQEALRIETYTEQRYTYFIFMDGNIQLYINPSDDTRMGNYNRFTRIEMTGDQIIRKRIIDCDMTDPTRPERFAYTYFECLLSIYNPPVASPVVVTDPGWTAMSFFNEEVTAVDYTSPSINAFHRNILKLLLPYNTLFDELSWTGSAEICIQRLYCIHGQVLQFNWIIQHPEKQNRYERYPTGKSYMNKLLDMDNIIPVELQKNIRNDNTLDNTLIVNDHKAISPIPSIPIIWNVHSRCYMPKYNPLTIEHKEFISWSI